MKNITLVALISLLTLSCRTSKHQFEEQAWQQVRISGSQERQHYLAQDSTKRYWHFASDSVFYFHPDSGLWAQGGWLYAQELSVHKSELHSSENNRDSTASQQHWSKTDQQTIRKKQIPWYVYVILILGIGSAGYFYRWPKGR